MASMQGNNILGEKRKETKVRSVSVITGFDQGGTRRAWRRTGGRDQDQNEWRTACGMWEKREGEKKSG